MCASNANLLHAFHANLHFTTVSVEWLPWSHGLKKLFGQSYSDPIETFGATPPQRRCLLNVTMACSSPPGQKLPRFLFRQMDSCACVALSFIFVPWACMSYCHCISSNGPGREGKHGQEPTDPKSDGPLASRNNDPNFFDVM